MDENASIRFYNAIRNMTKQKHRDNLVIGTVVSVQPLKINIGNNVVLSEDFLFLGQMCRPHKVTIPHNHIVDTHFSGVSPSIGTHISGAISDPAGAQETILNNQAAAKMNAYTELDSDVTSSTAGEEIQKQISDADLGRGALQSSITVGGSASIVTDLIQMTDNGHKHIIPRQMTKDVHFPKSDYENSVTICIEPALSIGDAVLMFAFNNFQMYYVAERIEGA